MASDTISRRWAIVKSSLSTIRATVGLCPCAAMTASSSDASRAGVALAPKPKDLALPGQGVASRWVLFCARAGQHQMARAAVIETMDANGRRNSLN